MGGDFGPEVVVDGALAAIKETPHEIILVGKPGPVRKTMRKIGMPEKRPRVVNADEVVGMSESPKKSLRKKKSSLSLAAELVKKGEADALVSMGNTGAVLATTVLKWRPLKGVSRPALAQIIPVPGHPVLLLDVGANVDCRPRHLIDFAVMGSIYAEQVFGCKKPRVGVLSIGEEDTKGNDLTLTVLQELKKTRLNVVGNAEGRDIFSGKFDVIICDGFVGNVVLKFAEAMAKMILERLKGEIVKTPMSALAAMAIKPHLLGFKKQIAPEEFGGAPLLGINGVCIVGHGSGNAQAVKNAILMAGRVAEKQVNGKIIEAIAQLEPVPAESAQSVA